MILRLPESLRHKMASYHFTTQVFFGVTQYDHAIAGIPPLSRAMESGVRRLASPSEPLRKIRFVPPPMPS